MSAVAAIFNVPSTQEEFNIWSFAHAAHHIDIIRKIYELTGKELQHQYVLDPFDKNNAGVWIYQHQLMHQEMDPLLGIAGYDLLDVNFTNPNEFAGWVWLDAQEHYQAANILSIG